MKSFEPLVDAVVGGWYGDESKALVVARKAQTGEFDYVARYNGGDNAGGTVVMEDGVTVFKFNNLPVGLIFGVPGIIGKGVLLNPLSVWKEIESKRTQGLMINEGNLAISKHATVILPEDIYADQKKEASKDGQGSTKKGISQAAAKRYARSALTMEMIAKDLGAAEELVLNGIRKTIPYSRSRISARGKAKQEAREWAEQTGELFPYLQNTDKLVQTELAAGKRILAEGAQSIRLGIDSQDDYPLVSSSHPGPPGILIGLGVNFRQIRNVVAAVKATPTRVGKGKFPTEVHDLQIAERVRGNRECVDSEYGTVTGRERRVGWPDLKNQNYQLIQHGISRIALTKLDCVPLYGEDVLVAMDYDKEGFPIYESHPTWSEDIQDAQSFDELPLAAQQHVHLYEDTLDVKVESVGVGPNLDQVIYL